MSLIACETLPTSQEQCSEISFFHNMKRTGLPKKHEKHEISLQNLRVTPK